MAEGREELMKNVVIVDPHERLKLLIDYSNTIEVDPHIPPTRYYRSGLEMVRMANVYYQEGSLENAYVLYLKFMTLFLEKIRKHPDFKSVPVKAKAINQAKLREILPKAEKLKKELLMQYQQEYDNYHATLRRKLDNTQPDTISTFRPPMVSNANSPRPSTQNRFDGPFVETKIPARIDDINYPDLNTANIRESTKNEEHDDQGVSTRFRIPTIPTFDRSTKPSEGYNVTKDGSLRDVIVPSKVMTLFERMAQRNTVNNVETCAILAGKLEKNKLFITHMIVPKQKGTSDSCMTTNEEEIFDYQDQHNLITIGWIHTHPTQTAFLSSVDLHTHCPYQLLMPEAIAIVCAPRYNETEFFVLTPDYGLKFIAGCRKTGFHPHPTEPPLFMVAEHVRIDQSAPLEVLDLRT